MQEGNILIIVNYANKGSSFTQMRLKGHFSSEKNIFIIVHCLQTIIINEASRAVDF